MKKMSVLNKIKNNKKTIILISCVIVGLFIILGVIFSLVRNNKIEEQQNILEDLVKSALMVITQEEFGELDKEGTKYAEGHKILRTEINGNKLYAYVVAQYGIYEVRVIAGHEKPYALEVSEKPIVLVFNVEEENTEDNESRYVFYKSYKTQESESGVDVDSLETLFPEDLIDDVKVDYSDDFYQKQIKSYLGIL